MQPPRVTSDRPLRPPLMTITQEERPMSELFGLPAHPLLVHGVVVLIPLVAFAMILMVVVPRTRRSLVWATLLLAVVGAILTPLAAESGEELAEGVRETETLERHEGLGEAMTPFAIALAIGASGLAGVEMIGRRGDRGAPNGPANHRAVLIAVSALAIVTAGAAMAQTVFVGHSGAQATWEDSTDGAGD